MHDATRAFEPEPLRAPERSAKPVERCCNIVVVQEWSYSLGGIDLRGHPVRLPLTRPLVEHRSTGGHGRRHSACLSGFARERAPNAVSELDWGLFFFSLGRRVSASRGSLISLSGSLECITSMPTFSSSVCWRTGQALIQKTDGWYPCKRLSWTPSFGIRRCQLKSLVHGTATTSLLATWRGGVTASYGC